MNVAVSACSTQTVTVVGLAGFPPGQLDDFLLVLCVVAAAVVSATTVVL